jgi:hypothetical protein
LSNKKPPTRALSWWAVSACGLRVGYMSGTALPDESSINSHRNALCVPRSMLGCQVLNGSSSSQVCAMYLSFHGTSDGG